MMPISGEPCVPSYRARKQAVLRCCSLIATRVRLQFVKERRGFRCWRRFGGVEINLAMS
jgi:hypothetical protein